MGPQAGEVSHLGNRRVACAANRKAVRVPWFVTIATSRRKVLFHCHGNCLSAVPGAESATKMVLLTQHYDTVTAVGVHSQASIIKVPYTLAGMSEVSQQVMQALIAEADMDCTPILGSGTAES